MEGKVRRTSEAELSWTSSLVRAVGGTGPSSFGERRQKGAFIMFILLLKMIRSVNSYSVYVVVAKSSPMQSKRAKFRSGPITFPCKKMPKFSTCRTITAGTACENNGVRS